MAVDGRQAALDNALKQIEKDFAKSLCIEYTFVSLAIVINPNIAISASI